MKEVNNVRLVFGVGVNDSASPVTTHETINGHQKCIWRCDAYQSWTSMLRRCYSPIFHLKSPTYIGCSVDTEWTLFSRFKDWMHSNEWRDSDLDKDLLFPGNRIYSKEKCVFISRKLNCFITHKSLVRGIHPIGVHWNIPRNKFCAQCDNPFTGKKENLGYFTCPNQAHEAWRKRKHQHALTYADMQEDERVAQALRIRYLPENLRKIGI